MGLSNFTGQGDTNNPNTPTGGSPGGAGMGMPVPVIDAEEFLVDYNERFKTAGTILYRESVTRQLSGVLIGKN